MGIQQNMKLSVLATIAAANGQLEPSFEDYWPANIDNHHRMLQTTAEHPEPTELNFSGRIPQWMSGSFYKNGPGIYEWGEDKYKHFFDPTGIVTRFQINGGGLNGEAKMHYHSKYIESTNFYQNKEAQAIVNPEVGTYGEPESVSHHDDGTPIEDEKELKKSRLEFLMEAYPTSNSLVSLVPFHGWLLSMNESPIIHLHDPVTLEVVHEVDLREAPSCKNTKIMTFTAHGMYDPTEDSFWNTAIGVDLSGTVPRTSIFIVQFPDAARPESDPFSNRATVDEIMDSLVISKGIHTSANPLDLAIPYFHMFAITENYIILPFTSVALDTTQVFGEMLEARPLVTALKYHPDRAFTYNIFNKNTWRMEEQIFETDPGVCVHTINAYETPEGDIRLDTAVAGNGDIFQMYGYETINSTGIELNEKFASVAPIGKAVSYTFDMQKSTIGHKPIWTPGIEMFDPLLEKDGAWEGMATGGLEFPIIDFAHRSGIYYENFWANGFGSFMPDRIYHVNTATRERWVYSVEGYSPSEPAFVKNPLTEDEDDGIIMALMSPLADPELEPFIILLDGRTLTYRAHAYLPEGVEAPVGFHGMWVSHPPMF